MMRKNIMMNAFQEDRINRVLKHVDSRENYLYNVGGYLWERGLKSVNDLKLEFLLPEVWLMNHFGVDSDEVCEAVEARQRMADAHYEARMKLIERAERELPDKINNLSYVFDKMMSEQEIRGYEPEIIVALWEILNIGKYHPISNRIKAIYYKEIKMAFALYDYTYFMKNHVVPNSSRKHPRKAPLISGIILHKRADNFLDDMNEMLGINGAGYDDSDTWEPKDPRQEGGFTMYDGEL